MALWRLEGGGLAAHSALEPSSRRGHAEVDDANLHGAVVRFVRRYDEVLQRQVPMHNRHVVQPLHAAQDLPHQGLQQALALRARVRSGGLAGPCEEVARGGQLGDDHRVLLVPVDAEESASVWVAGLAEELVAADVLPGLLEVRGVLLDELRVACANPLVRNLLRQHQDSRGHIAHHMHLILGAHRLLHRADHLELLRPPRPDLRGVEHRVQAPRLLQGRGLRLRTTGELQALLDLKISDCCAQEVVRFRPRKGEASDAGRELQVEWPAARCKVVDERSHAHWPVGLRGCGGG
mmetsp:Transcript_26543/g.60440  ORF Transcript_26543/g.60440 Transcript_26543/m.60440 type:complete len:293 (+) Transcript_26543:169-1047(+)